MPEERPDEPSEVPQPEKPEERIHKIAFDEHTAQAMLHRAVTQDDAERMTEHIAAMALGELSILCDDCGLLCHAQIVRLRDRFLRRGAELAARLTAGFELYFRSRQFGIAVPEDCLDALYRIWAELSILHDLAEPQERAAAADLPLEEQLFQALEEGEADGDAGA